MYHVVFKAEDAVVNVKLGQFFFMDADLVLLLDLHYPGLNLLPCCVGEFRLKGKKKVKVSGYNDSFYTILIHFTECILYNANKTSIFNTPPKKIS